ncbi:MAG: hypothetical protein A2044_06570 [Candidatus Firestonebacteria bacterium GWA2_43_8]|nr:MAG: hypothetical protein A2044_06570 [Candidatus Firestonebacteria bacterium GWA2_43_8]
MNFNKIIKSHVFMGITAAVVLLVVFIAVKNMLPTKQEKEFCVKLNELAEKHLIKSVYDEAGEKIDLYSLERGFSKRVVFSLAEDETKPAEIYSASLKVAKSGLIRKVKSIVNLSGTPDAEEGVYDVKSGWVAFSTSMGASFQSVTTVRTSGNYKKVFIFKPSVKKLQLAWEEKGFKLDVSYTLKDIKTEIVLDPIKVSILPAVEELKYFPEVKGEESWIAACVNFGRGILGAEFIGNTEAFFFSIKDWFDGISYSISRSFSGAKSDFKEGEGTSALKNIEPVIKNDVLKGEGVWTTDSLPAGEEKNHPLLARTIYRPDPERPYALVDLLYIDASQAEFIPVGGTIHPISTTGIKGKGIIPADDDSRKRALLAFSGGFQAVHGSYGMMVDGDVLLPAVNEIETLAMYADGAINIGVWGDDIKETTSLVSYRQNLKPLIRKGLFNDKNRYWGLSADKNKSIYVWRTGLGITKDKKAVFAIGNSVSAYTLAKAMLAAGVEEAMHLDMNLVNVACEIYTPEKDEKGAYKRGKNGEILIKAEHLHSRFFGAPGRYIKPHTRDFIYVSKRKK